MADKEEKKKEVDQLSLGEEKDVGAGEDIVFQIQVQQYRCSNLDANCCCYFPLFIYIKMQAIFWNLSPHASFFSLFSWLGWFGW